MKVIPEEFQHDVTNVTDISTYFSRPKLLNNLTYDDTTYGIVASYNINNGWIKTNVTNFNRAYGALGYRATVCFKLQAVSTPFHAGRLRMAFQPLFFSPQHHDRTTGVTPISQLPGVELDLAESTSVVLKIPFVHPNNFFAIDDSANGLFLGSMHIAAYTPVALAAGVLAPKLAVWLWLEDFELVGATTTDLVAQAGKFKSNGKAAGSVEADVVPGNVSNVLAAGANFSTWLGRRIPTISTFSGATSWALRFAANVAASHGWSKPIHSGTVSKMMNTYNVYQNNCDGPDPAYNLGATMDNAVSAYPGFAGTDVDEMSMDFLTSVFTAISTPTLSTTSLPDSVVYACTLSPSAMFYSGTNRNIYGGTSFTQGKAFWPTPIFSIADCFSQWRGGFKFRIKMSKTKFHTGRLVLGFVPMYPRSTSLTHFPNEIGDMQYKSVIWDLREGNVMEFECPYISPTAYLDFNQSYGSFFIAVIEPLVGPDTVSSSCPMVVEVAGAEDLEFAIPITSRYLVAPINSQFSAQAGEFQPTAKSHSNKDALYCVGERLSSIKQLLNRANYYKALVPGITSATDKHIYPLWLPNATAPTSMSQVDNSYFTRFRTAFAMYRGGYVLDAVPTSPDVILSAYSNMDGTAMDMIPALVEGKTAVHVKMPYYCERSRSTTFGTEFAPKNFVNITATAPSSVAVAGILFRRAADDFQLGYFIGFAPLTLPLAATANSTQYIGALTTRY